MDILKYLKNKELQIKNEDFDLTALENDARKGYIEESKVPNTSNMVSKTEYDTVNTNLANLTTKYSELETTNNNLIKKLDDVNTKMATVALQNVMISKGFKKEVFEEVSKLRHSLYENEKDDEKAINAIADRFKATYFPTDVSAPPITSPNPNAHIPNETPLQNNGSPAVKELKITRKTPIRDMIISH